MVKVPGDIDSTSEPVTGFLGAHLDTFGVRNLAIVFEFGTQPIDDVLKALVSDSWLRCNPQCSAQERQQIINAMHL